MSPEPGRAVFGIRPVEELGRARARDIAVVYVAEGKRSEELGRALAELRGRGVRIEIRSRRAVAALAGHSVHQGIVAITGQYRYRQLAEVLERIGSAREPALLLLADGVTDPHNLGALIRSAEVFAAWAVVVQERSAAPVTGVVVKASAGATERLPVVRVGNLLGAIDALRKRGVEVVGAASGRGSLLHEVNLCGSVALVVGDEGRGLREAVARRCSRLVQIPQLGVIASLNVSVAGAILLYEARRQRAQAIS